ncbi:MAG: GNAT family N-acetyltransferase [Geminicoccaceae bacterium]
MAKEDRSAFACGRESLDRYFHTQIGQDVRRRIATAFVAMHQPTGTIAGFYTLAATHVPFTDLDEDWRGRLPRYPTLPAVLVGRLAIDRRFQGQGLGGALLTDAARRAIRSDIGARFLIVDALDEGAARFYQRHGMRRIPGTDSRLFIPLSVLAGPLSKL